MAWTAWLTFQSERKAEFPGLNFEYEIPRGAPRSAVEHAVAALVERHEGLRTTFGEDEEGQPLQTVWALEPLPLHELDRAADLEGVEAFKNRDFAVDAEWPCRFALVAEGGQQFSLLACLAHITVDDHARDLLTQDFGELLAAALADRAPDLRPVENQPVDYALYERSAAASRLRERAERYWQSSLERTPVGTFDIGEIPETTRYVNWHRRSRAAAQQLERLAKRSGVPISAVFTAVFAVALHAATAKDVLPFTIASHGRVTANALDVVAPLARDLVLPVALRDDQSFDELSKEVHRLTFEAVRYSLVDTARFSEWKALAGSAKEGEIGSRISLNFIYKQGGPPPGEDTEWTCAVSDAAPYRASSHHLYVGAAVRDDTLELIVSGSEAVLGRPAVEALAERLTDLLATLDVKSSTVSELSGSLPSRVRETTARAAEVRDAAAEAALVQCVQQANGLQAVDTASDYVAAGGRFVRIPKVLRLLNEHGYEGLSWHDLLSPCGLAELATRIRPTP